jgi:hypothetical protein
MRYQIRFRSRGNPALAGASFLDERYLESTKARLEGDGFEIISVVKTPETQIIEQRSWR